MDGEEVSGLILKPHARARATEAVLQQMATLGFLQTPSQTVQQEARALHHAHHGNLGGHVHWGDTGVLNPNTKP